MNVEQLLQAYKQNQLTLIDTKKGLTNHNYYFEYDNQAYMLRLPRHDCNTIINYQNEAKALNLIKPLDIDVELIYYNEESGLKITKYLADALTYEEINDELKIVEVAKLMKKLHQANLKINCEFNPLSMFKHYQELAHNTLYDFPKLDIVLQEVSKVKREHVLCHNDWVNGNILFANKRVYLIDYEYAADNDPYFDVISFLSENQIYNEELRKLFYETYFDDFNESILNDLNYWELFADALWCHWALMMYESRHENIYLEIAKQKHDAYLKLVIKL